jgi:hypothetical protein
LKVLNELEYVGNIIKNGLSDNNIIFELKLVAKYYNMKGYAGEELENKIIEFCKKNIKQFNYATWFSTIERVCRHGERNSLFCIKPIRITDLEYERIKNINNLKYEKIAFVLLVLAKINKQSYMLYLKDKIRNKSNRKEFKFKGYYVSESINEIFKIARVYGNKKKKFEIIRELIALDLISVTKMGKIKVNFINNHSVNNFVVLSKFDNFILEYTKEYGVKVKYCAVCGCIIEKTIHNKKYCDGCAKDIDREKAKDRMKSIRCSKQRHTLNP